VPASFDRPDGDEANSAREPESGEAKREQDPAGPES